MISNVKPTYLAMFQSLWYIPECHVNVSVLYLFYKNYAHNALVCQWNEKRSKKTCLDTSCRFFLYVHVQFFLKQNKT